MARVRRRRHRERAAELAALTELHNAEHQRRERSRVLHQLARYDDNRQAPMVCTPTYAERVGRRPRKNPPGNDGKVMFTTRENAEQAARELEQLGCGRMRAYPCSRRSTTSASTGTGHYHLCADGPGARQARDDERARLDHAAQVLARTAPLDYTEHQQQGAA